MTVQFSHTPQWWAMLSDSEKCDFCTFQLFQFICYRFMWWYCLHMALPSLSMEDLHYFCACWRKRVCNIETVLINRACTDFCVVDRKRTSILGKLRSLKSPWWVCLVAMVTTVLLWQWLSRLQVEWERTDTYLVSAHSPDCIVRVWRSSTGELVSKLKVQRRVENKWYWDFEIRINFKFRNVIRS